MLVGVNRCTHLDPLARPDQAHKFEIALFLKVRHDYFLILELLILFPINNFHNALRSQLCDRESWRYYFLRNWWPKPKQPIGSWKMASNGKVKLRLRHHPGPGPQPQPQPRQDLHSDDNPGLSFNKTVAVLAEIERKQQQQQEQQNQQRYTTPTGDAKVQEEPGYLSSDYSPPLRPLPVVKMPPPIPGQKGSTGKKGRDRQSRSRNTTPSLMSASDPDETPYLRVPLQNFQTDEGIDNYSSGGSKDIPTAKDLEMLLERLNKLQTTVDARGAVCDRGMRTVVGLKKDRLEELESERRDEERKERLKKDALDEEERGRNKKASKMKKRKDASSAREERPLAHGAHGLAAQDGSHHPGKLLYLSIVHPGHQHTPRHITFTISDMSGQAILIFDLQSVLRHCMTRRLRERCHGRETMTLPAPRFPRSLLPPLPLLVWILTKTTMTTRAPTSTNLHQPPRSHTYKPSATTQIPSPILPSMKSGLSSLA